MEENEKSNDRVKVKFLQYGAKFDQSVTVSMMRSVITNMKIFRESLRTIIKFSDLAHDSFYNELGNEIDEYYIRNALQENEVIFVLPPGKRFLSSVKLGKYEYLSDYKTSKFILTYLAKDLISGAVQFIKKIECSSIGNNIQ